MSSSNYKRRKTISPWEELAADITPLIERRRSKYHDEAFLKDSLRSAMLKLWPKTLRANECTEELLYIKSLAFRLSNDVTAKQQIDQELYDLQFDHLTRMDILAATKKIIFDMFAMGLVGLCLIKGFDRIMRTATSEPHGNMVFVANMFIISVMEAYEKAFDATSSKASWKLRRMIKPGVTYFEHNCDVLRAVMVDFGAEGIELNGACAAD